MIINREFYFPFLFEKLFEHIIFQKTLLKESGSVNHDGLFFWRKFKEMLCNLQIVDGNNNKWIVKNVTLQKNWHRVQACSIYLQQKKKQSWESNQYFEQLIETEVKMMTFAQPRAMKTTRWRKFGLPYQRLLLIFWKSPSL